MYLLDLEELTEQKLAGVTMVWVGFLPCIWPIRVFFQVPHIVPGAWPGVNPKHRVRSLALSGP